MNKKRARGQGKQQKKAIDIFDALTKEGYDIGYTTVCSTIRKLLDKSNEAYIKKPSTIMVMFVNLTGEKLRFSLKKSLKPFN